MEERLFALRAAARKHHVDVDELAELRDRLASRLDMIEHADDRLKEAEGALKAAEADYGRAAKALTAKRKSAGDTLAGAVEAELAPLKMDKARFRVRVETDEDKPGASAGTRSPLKSPPIPARRSDRSTRSPRAASSRALRWR